MRIHSGMVKANKRDIECIKIFLIHAQIDMNYGGEGSYVTHGSVGNTNDLDVRELKKGREGLENIQFLLRGLCDKWN